MSQLRVGVIAKSFIDWHGGVDFIVYLANGVAQSKDATVIMLVPDTVPPLEMHLNNSSDLHQARGSLTTRLKFRRAPRSVAKAQEVAMMRDSLDSRVQIAYYHNSPAGFLAALRRHRLDVIFPTTTSFGTAFPVPWVGYIWDFQHRYFPEFFDDHEKTERDKIFLTTLAEAPAIIVNAAQIKKDIHHFFPQNKGVAKVTALPFTPSPKTEWLNVDEDAVRAHYALPKIFLLVANQFWLHKDHRTVLLAMARLLKKPEHADVHLVCTGKMEEPRDPAHIDSLHAIVTEQKLAERVHFLGFLPKQDQIAILRQARLVVQPTLYEGGPGGGIAYNAVALGVPLLLSDIPVNLEVKGSSRVSFFKAGSAADLAKNIEKILRTPAPARPSDTQLLRTGQRNLDRLSRSLMQALTMAIDNYQQNKRRNT